MAFSKSRLYPKDAQLVSGFARAFAHSARVMIIKHLSEVGSCCVEELLKDHPISQPTMSGHLRILREAHLIVYEEKYPKTIYAIDQKNLRLAKKYLGNFLKTI
ncbi:MAG: metalloregulator ArsR/SmtB family transcription factor [Saprospiraceae bacterium]